MTDTLSIVMAGLVPAIHAFDIHRKQGVDARDKRGHDESVIMKAGMTAFDMHPPALTLLAISLNYRCSEGCPVGLRKTL